jgi:NAD+ synthase
MTLRLALAPLAPWLGDLPGNLALLRGARAGAAAAGATLLATPQASLAGAALLDLGRDAAFLDACEAALQQLAAETADGGPAILLGAPWRQDGRVHDGLVLLDGGRVLARRARHAAQPAPFEAGPAPGPVPFRGSRLGLMAGEDLVDASVAETLAETGAELLLCAAARPFAPGGTARVLDHAVARVVETGLPLAWVGLLGGQGADVFPGGAFVLNADRSLALSLPPFTAGTALAEWDGEWRCARQPLPPAVPEPALLWQALCRGIADHVRKGGFDGAVLAAPPGDRLLAACARAALGDALLAAPAAGAALLSPLHRAGWLLGGRASGFAPLLGLYPSQLAALAAWHDATWPTCAIGPMPPHPDEPILQGLVEGALPPAALVAEGFPAAMVADVWRRVQAGGYNPLHATPGLTLGRRPDRRYPQHHGFTVRTP